MNTATDQLDLHLEQREKKGVALTSLLAALLLVSLKTVVGLSTQSLGVLSEAAHSGLDLIAAAITYFSVRVSGKPADADHQYGHGKVENFSAFLETGLLLLTCAWIVWEAVRRLFFHEVHVEPSIWAFGVMAVSITIDHFRSRALDRVARKYDSQALEADALHFRTDVWSSAVVIAGLTGVLVADRFGWTALRRADPIAALVVAGIVVWISVRLGKRTVDVLLDAAPAGVRARVENAVAGVEGVLRVERVRSRRAGNRTFVDVTVAIPRTANFERVHDISDRVEDAVRATLPHADVMVHELAAHEVREGRGEVGRLILDLDVEVDERLTLREAHALADRVEKEILRELPRVTEVNTHIEVLGREIPPAADLEELAAALEAHLRDAPLHFPELLDVHQVQVHEVEGKIIASCHATLDGALPIGRAHDLTQELETRTRRHFPQLFRFTIHTEPPEAR